MNFNSLRYFIFLPIVIIAYYLIPKRLKNPFLLVASYYFYMCWNAAYALLMLFSTAVTFACGLLSERAGKKRARTYLALSLLLNLAVLFFFKYFNFASYALTRLSFALGFGISFPSLNVLLPVGISFYTFQALGYTVDVYRGSIPAERSFVDYALFVSFFPQLVAGPIERTANMLPQLKKPRAFSFENIRNGLTLFLWGLMKKILIADNLAVLVSSAYNDPYSHSGVQLLFATVCFAFQIYCDFSGYTDIARGSASMLGISLMENFRCPYASVSIKDFWSRWHISLSTWFKDYLYFPLGGSRVKKARHYLNLLIVFLVSGLWHGASFTFILWGLLHGLYQILGLVLRPLKQKLLYSRINENGIVLRVIRVIITFILVDFAWVLFRANSLTDALYIYKAILAIPLHSFSLGPILSLGLELPVIRVTLIAVLVMSAVDIVSVKKPLLEQVNKTVWLRYGFYTVLVLAVLIFGYYGPDFDPQAFVYFQF